MKDTAAPPASHPPPEAAYGTPVPVPHGPGGFPAPVPHQVLPPYPAYPAYPPVPPVRPRPWWARRRVQRRLVPLLAVLLVGVILGDLVALTALTDERTDPARAAGQADPPSRIDATPQGNVSEYVAADADKPAVRVAPLKKRRVPHLFAVTPRPMSRAIVKKVERLRGVAAVETGDAAEVTIDGKRVKTMGVNPSTFRAFTPRPTAKSDALWQNIAAGDVAVSFVLGNDGGLTLGRTVVGGGRRLRVGAYATMGMGAIDAIVSKQTARALGIPPDNALVINAPKVDSARLRERLLRVLPKGSQVVTVNPVLTQPDGRLDRQGPERWPQGSLMTVQQTEAALRAAASKLGRPYVWGAEGPDSFDCSGLVQWAFAQAGVRMPRVTHQQFLAGPQVPLDQAQPGDLLFWRNDPTNPGYISHVAIYWGDGKMLHAPRTGDVVKIAPITTKNLAGVVRVSPQMAARVR
ncbi:NlpC/P60 family protein [Thermostaphylospora chromogena]|uniref:NlpC/P60 family protein n=1 Tax=Thermostaphylospora chromogena TaxID=35622 RepID=A0A1H1B690_9ACTN|nr:NlpC/P60 family protein [Thermostaphylospora chromogena]